ncbi:pectate lyase [Xylella taiwanensis]|nr:pectate lyase [Xylella taiwanensis]EWS78532.1 pectate lyase [Xylella taiwanensis]
MQWPLQGFAKDMFIAPDGSDKNIGTLDSPMATLMAAQEKVSSGDVIYLRGGIYHLKIENVSTADANYVVVNDITKDHISYVAYEREVPVFDFSSVKPVDKRVAAFRISCDGCVFRGFEIVGVQITIAGRHTQSEAIRVQGGNNNLFERLSIHDGMGIGWYLVSGSNNVVRNVDVYNNKGLDAFSNGNIDGFGVHPSSDSGTGNMIYGSRAWFNSDDGFDLINAHAPVSIVNCWAFYNGYDIDFNALGDGNGFKAGGYGANGKPYPRSVPRHTVKFSLAVGNRSSGFYANHHVGGQNWINNTAIGNKRANYNMLSVLSDNRTNVPGYGHYMRNNLGYGGKVEIANLGSASDNDISSNYFTLPIKVRSGDFVSLDPHELTAPRQPNGELPTIHFARLASGSAAIDAGVNIGEPFEGKAPDLGAFEATHHPVPEGRFHHHHPAFSR